MVKDSIKIDRLDLKILSTLQKQGRITNQNLAEIVSLSPSSCLHRVRRLEEVGIISSYQANLRLSSLCRSISCIVTLTLAHHTQDDFTTVEQWLTDCPEVVEAHTVSGSFDFFLRVVATDMDDYLAWTDRMIESLPETININTHVVMKEVKAFRGYPLQKLI